MMMVVLCACHSPILRFYLFLWFFVVAVFLHDTLRGVHLRDPFSSNVHLDHWFLTSFTSSSLLLSLLPRLLLRSPLLYENLQEWSYDGRSLGGNCGTGSR
ncbi:hypothetical protein BC567DRAFT_214195 [Phyllosticta citribraziliensis]